MRLGAATDHGGSRIIKFGHGGPVEGFGERPHGAGCERYFEMSVGSVNAAVSDEAFARGWAAFFEELDKELLASPATKKQRV